MSVLLGINIDHVATLRQARGTRYPDPVQAALIAEQAGADGITVHLREDRRQGGAEEEHRGQVEAGVPPEGEGLQVEAAPRRQQ